MNKDLYRARIDLICMESEDLINKLTREKELVYSALDLSDEEKLELESYINSKLKDLNQAELEENEEDLICSDFGVDKHFKLKSGLEKFKPKDAPMVKWLIEYYLPAFHPMPRQDIQHKVLLAWTLLNPYAVTSRDQPTPHATLLGLRGSGKTVCSKMMRAFYGRYGNQIRITDTGASIRDKLHDWYKGKRAGLCVFDNMHWEKAIPMLGTYYDLLIANNQNDCITTFKVSASEMAEKQTYCKKCFTTVYDLKKAKIQQVEEIIRRCVIFIYKSQSPDQVWHAYDWSGLHTFNRDLWNKNKNEDIYRVYFENLALLMETSPKDTPFSPEDWELVRGLVACGVFIGVWSTPLEGMEIVQEHLEWSRLQDIGAADILAVLLDEFIKEVWEVECNNIQSSPYFSLSTQEKGKIPRDRIFQYIATKKGRALSHMDEAKLIEYLVGYGYVLKSQPDGLFFVSQ